MVERELKITNTRLLIRSHKDSSNYSITYWVGISYYTLFLRLNILFLNSNSFEAIPAQRIEALSQEASSNLLHRPADIILIFTPFKMVFVWDQGFHSYRFTLMRGL